MNLKRKVWMALAFLLLFTVMTPTALAASETDDTPEEGSSFWEDVKSAGSGLYQGAKEKASGWWQSIKDAASDAVDAVKEHGPGWVESAQEKGSELLDKGANALQNAGEQVSGFLESQQDEFWERTEQQIYGGSSSRSEATAAPESPAPASSASENPADVVSSAPASSAPDETGSVPEDSATDGSAPPDTPPDTKDENPTGQEAGPENSQSHRIVADEDATNAEGEAETAESTEAASEPNVRLVWVAISLGLAAVACGSLYTLRNRR